MNPKRRVNRPWGATTNIAAVMLHGRRHSTRPDPTDDESEDTMGTFQNAPTIVTEPTRRGRDELATMETTAAELAGIIGTGRRVMIVGNPAGSFIGIDRDDRFCHYASSETTERTASRFSIPPNVGALVLTKATGINLLHRAMELARERELPVVGPVTSQGAVNRLVARIKETMTPKAVPPPPAITPRQVISQAVTPPAEDLEVDAPPPPSNDELAVIQVFEQAEAALSLARETCLTMLREAAAARAAAERNAEASETLETLKRLLTTTGGK